MKRKAPGRGAEAPQVPRIQRQRWRQRPGLIREELGIRLLMNRTPDGTSGRYGPALAAFVERPQSGCHQIGAVVGS